MKFSRLGSLGVAVVGLAMSSCDGLTDGTRNRVEVVKNESRTAQNIKSGIINAQTPEQKAQFFHMLTSDEPGIAGEGEKYSFHMTAKEGGLDMSLNHLNTTERGVKQDNPEIYFIHTRHHGILELKIHNFNYVEEGSDDITLTVATENNKGEEVTLEIDISIS